MVISCIIIEQIMLLYCAYHVIEYNMSMFNMLLSAHIYIYIYIYSYYAHHVIMIISCIIIEHDHLGGGIHFQPTPGKRNTYSIYRSVLIWVELRSTHMSTILKEICVCMCVYIYIYIYMYYMLTVSFHFKSQNFKLSVSNP